MEVREHWRTNEESSLEIKRFLSTENYVGLICPKYNFQDLFLLALYLPASQSSKSDCKELMYSIADLNVVTWKEGACRSVCVNIYL